MNDIGPAVGPKSVVLPFLNGLGVYDLLDERFGRDHVLSGVAYIATQLAADGSIHHLGAGDTVVIGARSREAHSIPAARQLHGLLQMSQGTRVLASDIMQALWDKWVMLATGAALTCLMRGTIAQICATTFGRTLIQRAIGEAEAIAAAAGYPIEGEGAARISKLLLDPTSNWKAPMARDIAQGAPRIEHEEIVGHMVRLGRRHNIDTQVRDAAYCHLQVYAATSVSA